jgi:hypothetical protein
MNKKASQSNELSGIASLNIFLGLREGSCLNMLGVQSWGLNSPQVHQFNAPPKADNYRQGTSSGRSRKDGVSRPTVIFALAPEESKGENDLVQLSDRMSEIWENSQRATALSLLPVLQNVF